MHGYGVPGGQVPQVWVWGGDESWGVPSSVGLSAQVQKAGKEGGVWELPAAGLCMEG